MRHERINVPCATPSRRVTLCSSPNSSGVKRASTRHTGCTLGRARLAAPDRLPSST